MKKQLAKESDVTSIPLPVDAPQAVWWDTDITGFGVVVGRTGSRTFIVQTQVPGSGKLKRRAIGILGRVRDDGLPWTLKLARIEAKVKIGQLASGNDPRGDARTRSSGPTLQEALDYHIGRMERGENRRGKVCSPRSIATTRGSVELHLKAWLERPLVELTADAIEDVMRNIEREAERMNGSNPTNPPGRAAANRIIANVSAIWRSYHKRYGLPIVCPADRLTQGALKPRDNRIADDGFGDWYEVVMAMTNHIRRDLQLVALFVGVRTDGVRNLRWEDIDFDDDLLHITKAKGDRPYTIPMTGTVRDILEQRRGGNKIAMGPYGGDHGFVFPTVTRHKPFKVIPVNSGREYRARRDAKGRAMRDKDDNLIRDKILPGVQASRKTFNSVAIEIGIPPEIRKALMCHEGAGVNVKSYGMPQNWDAWRDAAEKIEAAIWQRIKGERPTREKRRKLRAV